MELPENWVPFPNPLHGENTLQIPAFSKNHTLAIYSAEGRYIKSLTLESNKYNQINLNGLASGCYWLKLITHEGISHTKKLIVVK